MNARLHFAVAASALLFASNAQAAHFSDYTLTITGQCPGMVTVHWEGFAPGRMMGVVFGRDRGQFTIPSGVCKGTVLGLEVNVGLAYAFWSRDGSGQRSAATGSCCCGGFLQLVESGSCKTSNVAQLP